MPAHVFGIPLFPHVCTCTFLQILEHLKRPVFFSNAPPTMPALPARQPIRLQQLKKKKKNDQDRRIACEIHLPALSSNHVRDHMTGGGGHMTESGGHMMQRLSPDKNSSLAFRTAPVGLFV